MANKILYLSNQKITENAFVLTKEQLNDIASFKNQNVYWQGNMDTLVSAVSEQGTQKAMELLAILLSGIVAEWQNDQWYYYTCNAVVMHCCAGAYIRIVNQKEIQKNKSL